MKTTLAIEGDVLNTDRSLAARDGMGAHELASVPAGLALPRTASPLDGMRNGIRLLPVQPGSTAATLALVNQWRDDAP